MCGRYALACEPDTMAEFLGVDDPPEAAPRYNIAPSQTVPMLREAADGRREWFLPRWGLIPSWAKEPKTGYSTINARAETVAEKPAFRNAFKYRRGLIPATGYYEWRVIPGSKTKQPYFIHPADASLFAFAGLWERWGAGESMVESCTIIVTAANERTRPIHERMPVILAPEDHEAWLAPSLRPVPDLLALLKPCPSERVTAHRVGTRVNNPRNDSPDLIRALPEPLSPSEEQAMVDRNAVEQQWAARGFSCELWVDPPGQCWEDFVHSVDEWVMVMEGQVEFEIDGIVETPEPGVELLIPAGSLHSVRNRGNTTARWLYGYRRG